MMILFDNKWYKTFWIYKKNFFFKKKNYIFWTFS